MATHNRKNRIQERRSLALRLVRRILQRIESGDLDPYEGYRQIYAIYLDHSGLLVELNVFLDFPGLESKDHITVDQTFRARVVTSAKEWLIHNPSQSSA